MGTAGVRVGIGTNNPAYTLQVNGDILANSWIRTNGTTGWYSQTYGGGWYMLDGTYIRAYNNKSIYTTGAIRSDGSLQVGASGSTFSVALTGALSYYTNVLYANGTTGRVGVGTAAP